MFKGKEMSELKKRKYFVSSSVLMLLVFLFVILMAAWSNSTVNIYDDGIVTNVKTKQPTVADVLSESSITLGDFDKIEPALDTPVRNDMDIVITRAVMVTVTDNGVSVQYYSTAKTVEGVLNQTGYTVSDYDRISPAKTAEVKSGTNIIIERAKKIYIINGDETSEVYSCAETVGELLKEIGFTIDENTELNLEPGDALKNEMKIKITPIVSSYEDVTETIAFETETVNNSSMAKGTTKVTREGSNGTRIDTYLVKSKNGAEISREKVDSKVTKDPVNKIIEVGTASQTKASSASAASSASSSGSSAQKASNPSASAGTNSGKNFSYSKVFTCTATAYDLSYESCGKRPGDKNYGITASGMQAQYGVIAVDPSVIPLGTRLYIESLDGSWAYGYCVAGDTGGGIYGNRVDLFFNSRSEALQFGRRQVRVYVLN